MTCVAAVGLFWIVFAGPAAADEDTWARYLATTCTSCHLADGTSAGIPAIVGWDEEDFTAALCAYRTGERDNLVMHNVASTLDDNDVRRLAAYFAALAPAK